MKKNYSMFVKNIIATTKKYKFSIHKILFYEIFFILRGFKGNKIGFDVNDEFSANIPCPYYFLVKIKKSRILEIHFYTHLIVCLQKN